MAEGLGEQPSPPPLPARNHIQQKRKLTNKTLKETVLHFGKYAYLLSLRVKERINATLMSV